MGKIESLTIAELKTYLDLIQDELRNVDRILYIDGGTDNIHEKRAKLFTIKTLIDKEINRRINNLMDDTDGNGEGQAE